MSAVTRVEVPDLARIVDLERVDYADAFSVATETDLAPEQWLRLFLEKSPLLVRLPVMGLFLAAGARLSWPLSSEDRTLGWRITSSTADQCVASMNVRVGLKARLVALTSTGRVDIVTAVQLDTEAARRIWVVGQRLHRRVDRIFLANAARQASARLGV